MKKIASFIYTSATAALMAFIILSCGTSSGLKNAPGGDANIFLADPSIFFHDDTYYLFGTGSKDGFLVYTSTDLMSWTAKRDDNGLALKKEDAFGTRGFWAPQVFNYKGKFYMAYTANESIAIAVSESPIGPFKQVEKAPLAAPVKQIDPFIFIDDDGKKYLYHVRVANGGNRIYVAELYDDFSGIKSETLKECITATDQWENIENAKWSVTEGPSVLKRNNLYYLVYSANHFRSKDYAVGYAVSSSPYGPWKKHPGNPILSRSNTGEPGSGHGDFFRNNDELFYVFHTHNSDSTISPRKTAVVPAHFSGTSNKAEESLRMKGKRFHYLKTDK